MLRELIQPEADTGLRSPAASPSSQNVPAATATDAATPSCTTKRIAMSNVTAAISLLRGSAPVTRAPRVDATKWAAAAPCQEPAHHCLPDRERLDEERADERQQKLSRPHRRRAPRRSSAWERCERTIRSEPAAGARGADAAAGAAARAASAIAAGTACATRQEASSATIPTNGATTIQASAFAPAT